MKQMRQLLWKDYRLNRGLLFLGAFALAGVFVVGLIVEVGYTWPEMPTAKVWADGLHSYGHLALSITPFIAALLGGNAVACERADRSAHFLAYLPPTKSQIVTSKLLLAASALAIFWGVILVATMVIAPLVSPEPTNFLYMVTGPWAAAAGCACTFGVGWLGSVFLEKPVAPVLAALVSPFVLGYVLFLFSAVTGISRFDVLEWSGGVSLAIGIIACVAGCWYYFRRVEP